MSPLFWVFRALEEPPGGFGADDGFEGEGLDDVVAESVA